MAEKKVEEDFKDEDKASLRRQLAQLRMARYTLMAMGGFTLAMFFGSAFGYFAFNENPDFWTWIGGIVVFSSVLLITYKEKDSKKMPENSNIT